MIAADTNLLLRAFLNDVPEQSRKANAWLTQQPDRSVLIVDAVLVEVLYVLESKRLYGLQRAAYIPALLHLLSGSAWHITPLTSQTLTLFASTKLDYTDCLLATMQDIGNISAVDTFDKALQKQLGSAVL